MSWLPVLNLIGPTGYTGYTGIQGPTGDNSGFTGATGSTGSSGFTGPTGTRGTMIYPIVGDPSASYPEGALVGDFALDVNSGILWLDTISGYLLPDVFNSLPQTSTISYVPPLLSTTPISSITFRLRISGNFYPTQGSLVIIYPGDETTTFHNIAGGTWDGITIGWTKNVSPGEVSSFTTNAGQLTDGMHTITFNFTTPQITVPKLTLKVRPW